jgi:multiple sugar transport system substrate-binding protein
MRKRLTVGALLATVMLFAVVLVSGSQAMVGGSVPDSAKKLGATKVTTVSLNGWVGAKVEDDLLKEVIAAFEKSHPSIKVDYSGFNNYQTTMLAKFSARKPPDVFYVAAEDFADWVRQGVLQPLDSYAKKTKFSTKPFYKGLANSFKYQGKTYGYPKDWSSLGMQVNPALLNGQRVPQTWAQLRSVAQKINIAGGKPICLGADWARLMAFVYQAGGTGQFKNANSAPFRTAVNFYIGLIKDGLAATPDNLGAGWCGEAFGKEKVAIAFEGNWMLGYLKDTFPNLRYTLAPMPKGKTRGNLAFTVSYSMAKDSKNKAAAWTLLSWLTGKTGAQKWASLGFVLPARSDVKPVAGRGAFVKYPQFTHGWGNQVDFRHVWTEVANNELTAVLQGKETVNEMLAKIAAAAK